MSNEDGKKSFCGEHFALLSYILRSDEVLQLFRGAGKICDGARRSRARRGGGNSPPRLQIWSPSCMRDVSGGSRRCRAQVSSLSARRTGPPCYRVIDIPALTRTYFVCSAFPVAGVAVSHLSQAGA